MTLASYQSPHQPVTPLLVQLYDRHRLYKLAEDKSPVARQELCEIISDILESTARPSERELIADILISLIQQAERDLKCALADRLAVMDDAPLRLVLRFTEEEIDVATPVLRFSKVLNDLDLLYIIQAHDSSYWQVIAARENLHEAVIDKLADTRDPGTARVLAGNEACPLTRHAQTVLADIACNDADVARPLLQRGELPKDIVRKLYQHVAEDLKSYIQANYPDDANRTRAVVEDVVAEFTKDGADTDFRPTSAMLQAADLFGSKGQLTAQLMVSTLKRGQLQSFVAQFSRYCGLPVSVAVSILQQAQGQGLALAARANDLSRDDFINILLLSRRMVRADGVMDQNDLQRALAYYDRISKELAQRLLRGCR